MDTITAPWIRAGLLGLPLYGLLTLGASREPQPNPAEEYEAWARFVTTDEYILTHVLGSGLGIVLAIFGTFALGAYLVRTRVARLGLWSMAVAALGQCIFLFFGGISAVGAPLEGHAYRAGMNLENLTPTTADTVQMLVLLVGIAVAFVGNLLLGVAVWRSRALPATAGVLWIVAALLMYPFGIVLGALTTGATPITVLVGAVVVAVSGGWLFWHALRDRSVRSGARPQAATV